VKIAGQLEPGQGRDYSRTVMKSHSRLVVFACVLAGLAAAASIAASADSADVDRAFGAFWAARNAQEAAKLVPDVVRSGVTVDEASRRLKAGRPYAANVPKGVVRSSYQAGGKEFFYAVNVPDSYDPARRYQVRFQLHGGVSRESNQPRGDGSIGALAGAEQIYILPTAWADAMWWSPVQLENLNTILDTVKRTYNVDENRVVLSGVSDGGTGAFYVAMKATTPFASFLPLNGSLLVLRSHIETIVQTEGSRSFELAIAWDIRRAQKQFVVELGTRRRLLHADKIRDRELLLVCRKHDPLRTPDDDETIMIGTPRVVNPDEREVGLSVDMSEGFDKLKRGDVIDGYLFLLPKNAQLSECKTMRDLKKAGCLALDSELKQPVY